MNLSTMIRQLKDGDTSNLLEILEHTLGVINEKEDRISGLVLTNALLRQEKTMLRSQLRQTRRELNVEKQINRPRIFRRRSYITRSVKEE